MTEHSMSVLYLAFILQNNPNANTTTVMISCNSVKQYVPGYCYAQDGELIGSLEEKTGGARIYQSGTTKNHNSCYVCIRIVLQYAG